LSNGRTKSCIPIYKNLSYNITGVSDSPATPVMAGPLFGDWNNKHANASNDNFRKGSQVVDSGWPGWR